MNQADSDPHPIDIHVGARVRLRRKLKGMSQADLADKLGLTFQQVQKYERGSNRISASKLFETGLALGCPVSYFFDTYTESAEDETRQAASVKEEAISAFLRTPEGVELARLFPRVKAANHRRKILSLVSALADG